MLVIKLIRWGISSAGRAPEWHSGGQGFDSPILHQMKSGRRTENRCYVFCFYNTLLLILIVYKAKIKKVSKIKFVMIIFPRIRIL